MPTAAQFRTAASSMRTAAGQASAARATIGETYGQTGLTGGSSVERVVDAGINAGNINAANLAGECEALATLLDGRAEVCEDYWQDVGRWRSRHWDWVTNHQADGIEQEPRRPPKPARWVD